MKFVVLGVIILLVAYLAVSAYVANVVMKIPRIPLGESPESVGLVYEDISFPSRVDHVTLRGWYISGEGPSTIIVANGGHQNRVDPRIGTLELAKDLVSEGYNILLFDFRGRGESEGEGLILTHTGRDLGGAVDFIRARGCSSMGIMGFSTGGAESLVFAAEEDEDIAAIVSESSFASVTEQFVREATKQKGLPELLARFLAPGVCLMAKVIYGYEVVNPVDRVADVSCPVLFIHGELDDSVPVTDAYKLYQASSNPANCLWVVANAGHCEGYKTDPTGYIDRVAAFFE